MLIRKLVNISFTVFGILISIGIYLNYLPWWILVSCVFIWLLITGYGVIYISSGYFLKSYNSNPNIGSKTISLTFDDGPDHNTLNILNLLQKYNCKATFFCIGKQVEKYPEIAKKIIDQGHIIGNHTYNHSKWIDIYSTEKFTDEIISANTVIKNITGKEPLLFRPPYGVTNPNIARAIKTTGHRVIGWNKRSFDTTITSENIILKRVTNNLKGGDIILLHDTKSITISVLEQLLLFLQKNNYTMVSIDELFSIQAYA